MRFYSYQNGYEMILSEDIQESLIPSPHTPDTFIKR
jgi:hypothetical protein